MIDKPLSNRVSQMLGEQKDAPSDDALSQLMDAGADSVNVGEGVQVASRIGLIGKIAESLSTSGKVIKQGVKSEGELQRIATENAAEIARLEQQAAETAKAAEEAKALEAQKAKDLTAKEKRKAAREAKKLGPKPEDRIEPTLEAEAKPLPEGVTIEKPLDEAPPVAKPTPDQMAMDRPQVLPKLDAEKVKAFLSGTLDDAESPIDASWTNIKDPEDLDYIFRKTQELFEAETVAAKRGVLGDDEANALAKSLAENYNMEESLIKQQIGTTYNVEQAKAANAIIVSSARSLRKKMDLIQETVAKGVDDKVLLVDFVNHLNNHAAMQINFKAAKSEAGRAFRALRTFTDDAGIVDAGRLSEHISELGGVKNLQQMAAKFRSLTPSQQAVFIQQAGGKIKVIGEAWRTMYTNALISSPASLERALYGNMLQSFMRGIDSTFAATTVKAVDIPYIPLRSVFKAGSKESEDFVTASEGMIELANFFTQIPRSFKAFAQTFKTGVPTYKAGTNPDVQRVNVISKQLFKNPDDPMASAVDFAGKIITFPSRGMMALDDGAKAVLSQQELRKLAARQAVMSIKNGANVEDAMLVMAKNIVDPSPEVMAMVDKAAKEGTLQSDLGNIGKFIMEMRGKLDSTGVPMGTLLAPFIKTVINAQKQILARTPLAPVMKEVRDELAAGGARRQLALGKIHSGAAVMGLAMYATTEGWITGAGPTDPKLKKQMQETTGWQPFSMKWNNTYYSYAGFEPIGGLLGTAATIAELGFVYGSDEDENFGNLLLYSLLMPFKYIGQLPFMEGIGNFTNAIEMLSRDPNSEEASRALNTFFGGYARNMVGGVAPIPMPASGLLRQIERTLDPTLNEVRVDPSLDGTSQLIDFAFRSYASNTPILSKELKPKRNEWGEIVSVGDVGVAQWIFPFFKSEEKLDPISKNLVELGIKRGKPVLPTTSRIVNNIRLNDNEFSDLKLLMNQVQIDGKTYKMRVGEIIAEHATETKAGQFAGIANALESANRDFKKAAWQSPEFASSYPDAAVQIQKNYIRAENYYDTIKREPKVD